MEGSLRSVEVAAATFDREAVESLSMSEIKVLETVAVTLGVVAVMVGGLVVYAHNHGGLNIAD